MEETHLGRSESLPHHPGLPGGGYSVAAAAIVVFLAVVANILVNALPASVTQLDTTAGTLYTLSQETEDILDGLEQDVTIYWIVQSGQEDETLGTLLDRYAARGDYVTLETIDPDVSPNFLQEYVSGTVYNNSLIVESGDRNTYVSYEDIYEYSYSSDYSSYDVSFAGESSLTSAIDYVLSDTLPKLYTLTGHGGGRSVHLLPVGGGAAEHRGGRPLPAHGRERP